VAGGIELINGFAEINDPLDQAERFKQQLALKAQGDQEVQPNDKAFVEALEYGMPPTAGLGLGVDRLVMVLTNAPSLREVILFPTLKPLRSSGNPKS
jgi:lysyl-tRNA synthetase class 2